MKTLPHAIIVPARLNSGRLKNKAVLNETGWTLIEHTVDAAIETSRLLDAFVVVATDSIRISKAVANMDCYCLRDGTDGIWCGTVRAARCIEHGWKSFRHCTSIINWQVDEPLVDPADVASLAMHLLDDPSDIATLVAPMTEKTMGSEDEVKAHVSHGECLNFRRTLDSYVNQHHVGVYAFRPKTLRAIGELEQSQRSASARLEQLTWLDAGYSIAAVPIEQAPLSINTPADYAEFCALIRERDDNAEDV